MKRVLEAAIGSPAAKKAAHGDGDVVNLDDEDDVLFSAASSVPGLASPGVSMTKVKTRWLKSGRNEGALMTLNVRELRDEAKRLGFETTFAKIDTKDKYVTYLHKKYLAIEGRPGDTQPVHEDVENQGEQADEKLKSPKIKPTKPESASETPKKIEAKKQEEKKPETPKAKKSEEKKVEAPKAKKAEEKKEAKKPAASAPAVESAKDSKKAKASAKKAKSPAKIDQVSEDEKKLVDQLEEFFGAKKRAKGSLPENEWSHVAEIESLPLITINGQFTLQYPCDDYVCRKVIDQCSPAPFGMGSKTVMDKTVRDGWQVEDSKVAIDSKPWLAMFQDSKVSPLLETIRKALAPKCKKISAKFYKLLVYEKGSFFKAHKDTQREANHFGSIVVFLPSSYKGGELMVRHLDKQRSYAFSYSSEDLKTDLLKCHAVSFFTDCEHEVKPLESGYRIALTYNLFFEGGDEPVLPASITEAEKKLNVLLEKAFALPRWKQQKTKIGVVLQHEYTMLSLTPGLLKGEDKVIYDAFTSSGKYDIELTPIAVDAQGTCGDDEADEKAKEYYDFCIEEGYETKFKIRKRDFKKLLEREQRRQKHDEEDSDECDDDDEIDEEDDEYWDEPKGELLSEFVWNFNPWGGGFYGVVSLENAQKPPTPKGSVHFVSDWRKVAVGKVTLAGTNPTGNTGTEFELQYHAAAMLVKPKNA